MKYRSKKEAKKWAMEALGHGGLVAELETAYFQSKKELLMTF